MFQLEKVLSFVFNEWESNKQTDVNVFWNEDEVSVQREVWGVDARRWQCTISAGLHCWMPVSGYEPDCVWQTAVTDQRFSFAIALFKCVTKRVSICVETASLTCKACLDYTAPSGHKLCTRRSGTMFIEVKQSVQNYFTLFSNLSLLSVSFSYRLQ